MQHSPSYLMINENRKNRSFWANVFFLSLPECSFSQRTWFSGHFYDQLECDEAARE